MKARTTKLLGLGLVVLLVAPARAQGPEGLLTIDRIFASGEFREEGLGFFQWSANGKSYFTLEAPANGGPGPDLVRNDTATGAKEMVIAGSAFVPNGGRGPLGIASLQFSKDESKLLIFTNTQRVWRQNTRGDYWVLDIAAKSLRKLGGDAPPSTLMFAKFSPDGRRVSFVRENNLYVQNLNDMQVTALTTNGGETIINGTSDWVNEEELDIRDAHRWSPDGQSIAFWQFDTTGVGKFYLIDNTSGTYSKPIGFAYPKAGTTNSATSVCVVGAAGGDVRRLDVPGDPREHYIAHMEWTPDGKALLLQQFNRLQDTNRVMLADPKTGATRLVHTETDPAWLENENPVRWLEKGAGFLWLSEREGWRHAYRASTEGGPPRPITRGEFDVIEVVAVDEEHGWVYYSASPDNATRQALFRTRLEGGPPERVSPIDQQGWHTYAAAPNGAHAVHTFSNFTTPPIVELVTLPEHKTVRVVRDNARTRERLARLKLPSAEFLRVPIGEGVELDAWCLKPPDFREDRQYPLLFHVYGEPAGATVHDVWDGGRGLWHRMLAQRGYLVASVDNRGTKVPRGRAFRKSVHRQIGVLASSDQAAAARALLERWPYADKRRVGIWGWSGGGSMSLNAIFRHPNIYQTAIAVAPVADERLYDTIYQERYMGLPQENVEGYRQGSPITHAKGLKGDLLLVHGTGDDNCHIQATELLINELVALNKKFEVLPYPGRTHAIAEGRNTTRHLHMAMTAYLDEHLLKKGAPSVAAWEKRSIEGWTVHISARFAKDDGPALDKAIDLMRKQLVEITKVVPERAVRELRKVPLFVSPEYPGVGPRAEYHPGAGWLIEHGRDPAMEKGVEFTNVRIFEAETRRMPNFVLHELAHAFHDRVLGYGHKEVEAAFERAKAGGKYDRVERQDSEGRRRLDRAYALTSPQEYFAETTEAYYARNDFFPFDRAELLAADPEMAALLKKVWEGL